MPNSDLRNSLNEVLLSDRLRKCLDDHLAHKEYFTLLKNYQRTICLLSNEVISDFTDV